MHELFELQTQLDAAKKAEAAQSKLARVIADLNAISARPDCPDPQAENVLSVASLVLPVSKDAVSETGLAINSLWASSIQAMASLLPRLLAFWAQPTANAES